MRGCDIGNRLAATMIAAIALTGAVAAQTLDDGRRLASAAVQAAAPAPSPIQLEDVAFDADGTVSGVVVNRSADVVREVRLLVRYDWQWQDERSPGDDSPARSTYVTVQGDVPALGTKPFRFAPAPPLPERGDGRFTPSVEVARYTQIRYKRVMRPAHGRKDGS